MTQLIDRLSLIADAYDLFLVDQWGVLHDGAKAHDGAKDALRALREADKRIVLISNSSKRVAVSETRLAALGIDRDFYDGMVTSGEMGWHAMRARTDSFYAEIGRRCFLFTWAGDNSFLDGQDLEEVDTVAEAEFVILSGTGGAAVDTDTYENALQDAAARDLPMVCLNRDFVSVSPEGELIDCTGKLAQRYEELGGTVRSYGKPGREIYDACLALAPGTDTPLMIGDSLHHDIAGANNVGIDSVLITNGIHRFDLDIGDDAVPAPEDLSNLSETYGARPTYAMTRFVW